MYTPRTEEARPSVSTFLPNGIFFFYCEDKERMSACVHLYKMLPFFHMPGIANLKHFFFSSDTVREKASHLHLLFLLKSNLQLKNEGNISIHCIQQAICTIG